MVLRDPGRGWKVRKGRKENGTECVKQLELSPTGDLWETAQNTVLNIVQLRSEGAGIFVHHLLPLTG